MLVTIRIKPNSRKGPLIEVETDGLTVFIRERAVDGQANEALVKLLAGHFGVPKTKVRIVRGAASKIKIIEIEE